MVWRVSLLVVTVAALALAGGALYVHQIDNYPLRHVPAPNPRANAAQYCSQRIGTWGTDWAAPDGSGYPNRSGCVEYVLTSHEALPDAVRPSLLSENAHNRREREIEWLAFAAVGLVFLFAASAALFARRRPVGRAT